MSRIIMKSVLPPIDPVRVAFKKLIELLFGRRKQLIPIPVRANNK